MLIDDDKICHRMYRRAIERSELFETVLAFTYAQEALSHLQDPANASVDVIFLDINMPRMNGFEFLEAALEQDTGPSTDASIVMLTTSQDPGDLEKSRAFEAVKAYLNKPLTKADVAKIVALVERLE